MAAIVSLSTGIITSYMSDHGCSKTFIAVAVFSFIYFLINVALVASKKSWERNITWFFFIMIIGVVITSIVGLAFSIIHSVCDINVCGEGYASRADGFWN